MINLLNKDTCCGCAACAQACPKKCITMKADEEGFLYPYINKAECVDCGICEKVCPFIMENKNTNNLDTYASHSMDEELRMSSSSGGIFSVLARMILENKGFVFGVKMSQDCKSCSFIKVDNIHDLAPLRGSKYIQSEVKDIYQQVELKLKNNKKVLFSGTPCQVNGLKRYLKKDYENLYCLDFVCHGVPSPLLWKKYAEYIEEKQKSRLISVNFRTKKINNNEFGVNLKTENRDVFILRDNCSYFKLFIKNYCLRPSCYKCKAKKTRLADITVGDYWGIEKVIPEMSDPKGVSMILVRTEKGRELVQSVQESLKMEKTSYDDAVKDNSLEYKSVDRPNERDQFFIDMNSLTYNKLINKYLYNSPKLKIKKILINNELWKYVEILRKTLNK